jgi:DNA-binding transcriptional LysR family regulator
MRKEAGMRLRQIEVFHAIYTSGSMTNAAAMLNVSQPSVSKVLAHAEQQLGYLLFDRVKGKLIPTPEAHLLFKHVSSVYKNVDRLRHVAENLKLANNGCVRIASTPAFGLEVLPRAVATFRRQHDNVIFEIETLYFDEMTTALTESRVDIGLAFEPVSHPDVMEITLATGRFMVLAPADIDFDGRTSLTAEDVAPFPYIGMNSRGPLGRMLSNHLASAETELNVVTWSETYHVAKSLVAQGAGLTLTDEITARSAGADNIQALPLEPALEFKVQALHLGSSPLSIGTNNFVQHLQETLQAFLSQPQ